MKEEISKKKEEGREPAVRKKWGGSHYITGSVGMEWRFNLLWFNLLVVSLGLLEATEADGKRDGGGAIQGAITEACRSGRLYVLRKNLMQVLDDDEAEIPPNSRAGALHTLSNLELILDGNVNGAVVRKTAPL